MKTKLSLLCRLSCVLCLLALSKAFAKATAFKAAALCSVLCALSFVPSALSQIPQGFNYQAIARDGTGNILANTSLQAMMYIQSESTGGTLFWKELHPSVMTNSFGHFTLVVGAGDWQSESTVATFDLIDWSVTPKYLKTEIYYSSSWKDMGTSQLMSVPYAITSGDLAGTVDKLSVKGTTSGLEDALFEVKNKDGQTVFAVYNEGVRVYVSDGAKAVKGGFAVGGFGTDKAESAKYLFVGKDSVRIYLDTNPLTKKLKGGFAVGGYDISKGTTVEDYLQVTRDSTRIYVNEGSGKAQKGGFAVGGFDITKGTQTITPFTSLTSDNYFIGHLSGLQNTSGLYNSFYGYETGKSNTEGDRGIFLGYKAGYMNTSGDYNTFIGSYAGYSNIGGNRNVYIGDSTGAGNTTGSHNVFAGHMSGRSNTEGSLNTFIGEQTGKENTTGYRNIFIGTQAGASNTTGRLNLCIGVIAGAYNTVGERNIFLGQASGMWSDSANYNIFIGDRSGAYNTRGANNVMIGSWVGHNSTTGNNNVFLGDLAGYQNQAGNMNTYIGSNAGKNASGSNNVFLGSGAGAGESGSNKLYIANTSTSTPLIYGIFDDIPANQILTINGKVGIGTTPTQYLDVDGNARFRNVSSGIFAFDLNITSDGTLTTSTSDISMKENIDQITNAIEKVNKLRGVTFTWKSDPSDTRQMGMIAQDVEPVVPEIVFTNPIDGLKGINYSQTTALLVEAIKEQQQQIESYKSQLQTLQEKVDKIESILAKTLDE